MTTIFFDSHGHAHRVCSADHPRAVAFGPTGVSRPVTIEQIGIVPRRGGETDWVYARRAGALVEGDTEELGWDTCDPGQGLLVHGPDGGIDYPDLVEGDGWRNPDDET